MKPIYRDLSQFRVLYNKTGLICNGPKLYYKNRTYGSSGTAFYFKGFSHGLRLTFPGRNDVVDLLNRDFSNKKYLRGHIINSELDGSLNNENLVPLTFRANRQHATIENWLKTIIRNRNRMTENTNDLIIGYEVNVLQNRDGIPISIRICIELFYMDQWGLLIKYDRTTQGIYGETLLNKNWNIKLPYKKRIVF